MAINEKELQVGQRVITPDGEGEIASLDSKGIQVKLNSGEIKNYSADKLSDDADAG